MPSLRYAERALKAESPKLVTAKIRVPHLQDRAYAAARDFAFEFVARLLQAVIGETAQQLARCTAGSLCVLLVGRNRGFQAFVVLLIVIEIFVDRILVQNYPQVAGVEGPGVRRQTFLASSQVLLRLDSSNLFSQLKLSGKAEFVEDADAADAGLAVRCRTLMDGVLIPALPFAASDDVIVSIEIESPVGGGLDFFFQKQNERSYERRRVCSEKLYKGPNHVFIRLFAGHLAGPMFLHLRDPGLHRISSIEVRAVHV